MKNKNLWLLPTDKPSRLYFDVVTKELLLQDRLSNNPTSFPIEKRNIYITDDSEIKEGDWLLNKHKVDNLPTTYYKKIILTTDIDLIKYGVQKIDEEFLEWICKNPSCEEVEIEKDYSYGNLEHFDYKIIIPKEDFDDYHYKETFESRQYYVPKEKPKQETLVNDFMVWDELFGIIAWKFKPTKSGDLFLDAEKAFEELKDKFELKKK